MKPTPLRRSCNTASPDNDPDDLGALDLAITGLARRHPRLSAHMLLEPRQAAVLFAAAGLVTLCVALAPVMTLHALHAGLAAFFMMVLLLRICLTAASFRPPPKGPLPLDDADLPSVTILTPVFDEAMALPSLAIALRNLDYPADRLDIKILFEARDRSSLDEAYRLGLDREFEFVIVPDAQPRTKPKACNFGLQSACGDYVVIYDAEDIPEADQLRKAAAAFATGGADLACVQARLNFYNAEETWLTRLFALEYALWFDCLLPALVSLGAPIPLGGTSNIFRRRALIEVGGWDAFNVTEDADLGLRLARLGYRTQMLDSTTFEEANCAVGNWLRQRSRWMKGFMQTWLVHMRDPIAFHRATGWRGAITLHLLLGGTVVNALVAPLLFVTAVSEGLGIGRAANFGVSALVLGNAMMIMLALLAPIKRGWRRLRTAAFLMPIYWVLTSIAAYKALWQLVTRTHFWEKTDHTISKESLTRRHDALHLLLNARPLELASGQRDM